MDYRKIVYFSCALILLGIGLGMMNSKPEVWPAGVVFSCAGIIWLVWLLWKAVGVLRRNMKITREYRMKQWAKRKIEADPVFMADLATVMLGRLQNLPASLNKKYKRRYRHEFNARQGVWLTR